MCAHLCVYALYLNLSCEKSHNCFCYCRSFNCLHTEGNTQSITPTVCPSKFHQPTFKPRKSVHQKVCRASELHASPDSELKSQVEGFESYVIGCGSGQDYLDDNLERIDVFFDYASRHEHRQPNMKLFVDSELFSRFIAFRSNCGFQTQNTQFSTAHLVIKFLETTGRIDILFDQPYHHYGAHASKAVMTTRSCLDGKRHAMPEHN